MMRADGKSIEPSLEEVLASIRRILADTPSEHPTSTGAASRLEPRPALGAGTNHLDAFELPALFRAPHRTTVDQLPPQLGGAIPGGHHIDWQPRAPEAVPEAREKTEPPAPLEAERSAPPDTGASSPLPGAPVPPDVPRRMAALMDTRLAGRMGQSGAEARHGQSFAPVEFRAQESSPSAAGGAQPSVEMRLSGAAGSLVDEAAVALLRPLLKQWLDANMRTVLERALREEIASTTPKEQ